MSAAAACAYGDYTECSGDSCECPCHTAGISPLTLLDGLTGLAMG